MIFITVGSRNFQFDRLLEAIDLAIENGEITDKVFAQVGKSKYKIKNFDSVDFLDRDKFNEMIDKSDLVLTHGGTGVIINSLKKGKKVLAVPRLSKYNEAVDDHQVELVRAFEKNDMVVACYDCNQIVNSINLAMNKNAKIFNSNTINIMTSIEDFITDNNSNTINILMCGSARTEKGGMNSVIEQLMNHRWSDRFKLKYLPTHISGNNIKKTLFFINACIKLIKMAKNNEFDIVHVHMSYKGSFYRKYYVAKLCKKYDKKVIIHLHGSEFKDFYNKSNQRTKRKISNLFEIADTSIVLGSDWEKYIKTISKNANVVVVNNSINIPSIDIEKSPKKKRILFLGALIKRKGTIDLLQSINQLIKQNVNDFELIIAGSGEEENYLKTFAKENNLQNYVNFLGWIEADEKKDIISNTDILVLPSYNEGLPIAILEAMSYGAAIISTDVGSISEIIDGNGYLFKPGDIDAMSNYLKELIINDNLLFDMRQKSRNISKQKFSDDVFFNKIESIYDSINV